VVGIGQDSERLLKLLQAYWRLQPAWFDPRWQSNLAPVDRVTLAQLLERLQPLLDVAALREVGQEQQAAPGQQPVLGAAAAGSEWKQLCEEVLDQVLGQSQSQTPGQPGQGQPSSKVKRFSSEALGVLGAAADGLAVELLGAGQALAAASSGGGRQQLQVQDLRLAAAMRGLGHLLPPVAVGGAGANTSGQLLPPGCVHRL
jgi:hypothetical protein